MKNSPHLHSLKLGALCAGLFAISAGVAHAQSSVTLYGTLDAGMNYTSNAGGSKAFQMTSDDLNTSRWGLKGTEDLGGGLHAIFDLESAFALENGQSQDPGALFGYQSYVGLQSDHFGTLTMGRQYDSVVDVLGPLTVTGSWGGLLFTHPLDNDNVSSTFQLSNSIKYTSANFNGLTGTASYGFSNAAGAFAQNRAWSLGAGYTQGTLQLGAAFSDLTGPGSTAAGAVDDNNYSFVASSQKIWGLGANYGIGKLTLGAVYTHTNVDQPTADAYIGAFSASAAKFDNFELSAKYNLTDAFMIGGMYTYTRASIEQATGNSALHWNQIGVMAQYNLSKRTSLYAQGVYQGVSGNSGTLLDDAYIPGAADVSSSAHQVVARVGISHIF